MHNSLRIGQRLGMCGVLTLLAWHSVSAQAAGVNVSKVGTTAAAFLEIPVGARAIGMGRAFVSTANDISSLYWNPAGLARLSRPEATFNQIDWIAEMSFNYAAVGVVLGDVGSLGLSFSSLSMDDMPVRTIERPQGTGELFSAGSFAVGLHYARNLSDRFSIGFTGKYISERIWNMQSQAFAIDLGVLFTTSFFGGARIGAIVSNFGTDLTLSGRDTRQFNRIDDRKLGSNERIPMNIEMESWPLPLNFQFGVAVDLLKSEMHVLTVEVDALHPSAN
ncbi:MAG: PorV/PorQ family protein, partial [Bacteroidota bacterium]